MTQEVGVLFKSKVLNRLLLSSVAIAILPLVTILLLTNFFVANVATRENALYTSANSSMSSISQHAMEAACSVSHIVAQNDYIRSYATSRKASYWNEHLISMYLTESVAGMQYIEDCFIYLQPLDRIISIRGNHASDFYFGQISGLERDQLDGVFSGQYLYALIPSGNRLCAFSRIHDQYGQPVGYCVVELNLPVLLDELNAICPSPGSGLILASENSPLAWNRAAQEISGLTEGKNTLDLEDVSSAYSCYINEYSIYGNVFSVMLMAPKTLYPGSAALWILLGCFLVTLGLCIVVSYMNYRPVKRISGILHKGQTVPDGESEYQMIETSLLDYEDQVEKLSEKIQVQNERFRSYYLEKLLLNRIPPKESVGDILSFFGMTFYDRQSFVCILDTDRPGEWVEALCNDIRNTLQAGEEFYSLQIDAKWIFVCVVYDAEAFRAYLESMKQCRLEDGFNLYMGASVDCGEKLWRSYSEALRQMTNRLEDIEEDQTDREETRSGYSDQCIQLIHNRFADEALNAEALADECGVTLAYLSKVFKHEVGMGLLEYLQRYRVNRAKKKMNAEPEILINAVCREVGYSNVATFIRVFKKYEGVSPGAYRDQLLESKRKYEEA